MPSEHRATGGMKIDHVPYGVRDLDHAVERFEANFGLRVLERGTHPELGTHNAILPVGYGQFIELLAIADPTSQSPLVTGLKRLLVNGDHMAAVCIRAPDLDATAHRLSLRIIPGERHTTAGRVRRFRRTVVETDPQFPFFIDWLDTEAEMDTEYGAAAPTHGVAWVEIGGDQAEVAAWIADDQVPVRVVSGRFRGPLRFALRTSDGGEMLIE